MSHIPNSAMPHAGTNQDSKDGVKEGGGSSMSDRAGKIADKARENPKTAVAAGIAVVGAIAAAAAIPLVRGRKKADADGGETGGAKKSGGRKPAAKKS